MFGYGQGTAASVRGQERGGVRRSNGEDESTASSTLGSDGASCHGDLENDSSCSSSSNSSQPGPRRKTARRKRNVPQKVALGKERNGRNKVRRKAIKVRTVLRTVTPKGTTEDLNDFGIMLEGWCHTARNTDR